MRGRRSVVLVMVAATLVACGSDDDAVSVDSAAATSTSVDDTTTTTSTPVATTTAPVTSAPTTTADVTTTDAPTTVPDTIGPPITAGPSTTTPGITVGFDPACVEQPASPSAIEPTLDADLATFGPLGVTPAITINLPLGHSEEDGSAGPTQASVARIPGGFLVGIVASSYGSFDGSIYAAIDATGSVRWVRCYDERLAGPIVGAVDLAPSSALVSTTSFDGGVMSTQWLVMSLLDGEITADLAALAADAGVAAEDTGRELARTSREVLLGTWADRAIDESTDRILRIDLATMEATTVPYPPGSGGQPAGNVYLWNPDEDVVMTTTQATADAPSVPAAVLVDGAWSTDPADLAAARPATVVFDEFDGPGTLAGYDAIGRMVWERNDIGTFGGEGFRTAISGDIAVVSGCAPSGDFAEPCTDEGSLFGLDVSTGDTLWQLEGGRGVLVMVPEISLTPQTVDRFKSRFAAVNSATRLGPRTHAGR